ncbi:hypothetical protein DDZ13_13200 [Coraliomargarita sinensis]|uniref:HTH araC/xylS-type domain-containing protein n=1 Tax=Coraliomargarita sinensis TaxID=2174842 RepID=A0A317ZD54_9BACT|nr:substrate-binding domain-containing protein [Coraliomargarita sinensis]PXA03175.1 hypothetical protein DDZ13_13200 [Coraliomargarita sinensis]
MKNSPDLVAIAYDLNFRHAAEIFSGVSDFVQKQGLSWRLLPLNFDFETKLMEIAASGRLSGAIGTFVSDSWIEGLSAHQVVAVNLFNFSRITKVPSICLDDQSIGQTAARHLLEQGARSLTFISQDEAYFNRIRQTAFVESCPPQRYHKISPTTLRRVQVERLHDLDAPVGVLCSNDRIAREVCQEARLFEMEVGKDLLVVGVGNEPAESTFAGTGLSSFEIPAREIGYRAAQQMEKLLQKEDPLSSRTGVELITAKLIPRESTLPSPQARLAERATALIEESMGQAGFDVASLCHTLGISRRALELTIRRQLNKSPYQMISERRLAAAMTLLTQTNHTITKVGEACGYPEPHHFSAWFKQRAGLSPKKFRQARS